jgi:hypothetical protein
MENPQCIPCYATQIENKVYGNNYPRPLPELLKGEEVYEVETIFKHRRREKGYQYYVK